LTLEHDNPRENDLACEGKRIIEHVCGMTRYDMLVPESPLLQAVLSEIPYE
jgi:hypothetical protein